MRYIKAEDALPEEVVALIQQYVDGVSLYIPRKPENRQPWGGGTTYRRELDQRNQAIREDYAAGVELAVLEETYHLSRKSIQKILHRK